MSRVNTGTIYITNNGNGLFKKFKETFGIKHDVGELIDEVSNDYNSQAIAEEFHNGMIKFEMNDTSFIILDRDKTLIYDSMVVSIEKNFKNSIV